MQNQSNTSSNGFTLMPMGAQQFYQMAQQHAMANATFAPSVPAYLPLSEPELYSSMMSFGAYTMPQNMMQQQASMEAYQTEQSYQGFGFGVGSAVAPSSTVPTVATAESYLMPSPYDLPSRSYASSSAYHIPMSPIPAAPLPSAQREKEGAFPSDRDAAEHISDAPFADEHKWRKYGQKQVKRSPYPRNYYKCTVPGCPAKKHLEKFWDTSANRERCRTIYIGEHVHPVAASPQVFAATQLDFQNNVLAQSSRIRTASPHASEADVAAQQRLVVECGVNVDENEDGYYWRKYGQKSVKGSLTPRQYYRCRVANCQVKKTVEASPKGSTIVTYEGCHCHEPGMHAPTQAALLDSSPVSPASILSSARSSLSASPNPAAAATVVPAFRLSIKQEEIQPVHFSAAFSVQYPAVDSPSSTFSTTDEEDESYLSEPSPKRSFKDEDVAASYDNAFHQFAPDAPSADAWYWDSNHHSELLSQ